jgi:DNA-binding NtrC family response regulator
MKVVETWQTEQQDDSAVDFKEIDQAIAHVRVLTGRSPHAVHVFPSRGTSLGRVGGDCDFVVDDGRMSRRHARIERSAGGWQLQDLGARNRGFVDGRGYGSFERVPLADGAVLRFGDTLMVFRASPPTNDGRVESAVFPGLSPVAVQVRRRIDTLAAGAGHVLILGETGTGKERVAKAIADHRAPHPFVTLNSAELSRDLARSELFGYARGAFTDARNNRAGLVETAGEGVLFLDEIGELSFDVQPELLRFLEDGSYRPVGSTELRHSNARLIAATHVNLDKAVDQGKFRRDLLARLRASNTPLQLPALRDRREDILGWTEIFFRLSTRDVGPTPWTAGALECLLLYPWTENLRGLGAVVTEVATESPSFPCKTEHLPQQLVTHRGTLRARTGATAIDEHTPQMPPRPPPPPTPSLPRPNPNRGEIEDVLRQTQGNMRMAAQLLGIDRRRLYRLCEQFGIERESYRGDTQREDE